jgi:KDEL-tailed cysteine endopeptidase
LFSKNEETGENGVSFDWRNKGAVNPVRDQLGCSASYAFATTAAVETAYFNSQTSNP